MGVPFVNHTKKMKKVLSGVSRVLRERVSVTSPRLVMVKEELLGLAREVVDRGKEVFITAVKEEKTLQATTLRMMSKLRRWLELTGKVIVQTEAVLRGEKHIPERLMSIFDPGASPIIRGKARKPVEFGRKVYFGESEHGIVTFYEVMEGNSADNKLLPVIVKGHKRLFRRRLKAVAADRGFHSQENEAWLKQSGVSRVCLPHRGKVERERRRYETRQSWFRRLLHFRAGAEGRVSVLKRKFGLHRSLMGGSEGTHIWMGFGLLAHNLWQAARRT
jgi:IS5 family transposase